MARKEKLKRDEVRENRITMEIIVDAYGEDEQVMGWYYYLEDTLMFPFTARCIAERQVSPLRKGDEAEVIGMAAEDECHGEMFVLIRSERRAGLAVPLSQLKPSKSAGEQTIKAVEDWHYWVAMGYQFG